MTKSQYLYLSAAIGSAKSKQVAHMRTVAVANHIYLRIVVAGIYA